MIRTGAKLLCCAAWCTLLGCKVEQQMYSGRRLPRQEVAWLQLDPYAHTAMKIKSVDGRDVGWLIYDELELLSGQHDVLSQVTWSNRHAQEAHLQFRAETGGAYVIGASESEWPPRVPSTQQADALTSLAGAAAGGALAGAGTVVFWYSSPIWLPIAVIYLLATPPPDHPPPGRMIEIHITRSDGSVAARWEEHGPAEQHK
jgi:hypothetical protein